MRQTTALLAGFLALFASSVGDAFAQRGVQEWEPYIHPGTKYEFPSTLGGLKRWNTISFSGYAVDLGVVVPYQRQDPWIKAEIYLYTRGVKNIPDGLDNAIVRNEMDQAIADIVSGERRKIYKDVEFGRAIGICPAGPVHFLCLRANYRGSLHDLNDRLIYPGPHDVPTYSSVHLRGVRGHFMKIRVKWHLQDDAAARPIAMQFIDEFGNLLHRQ